MTRDSILTELDRLKDEIEKMRTLVACVLAEEQEYETPTIGGIVPMALVEQRAILAAVNAMHGNVLMAARKLGIGKTTVYRKLREYAIANPSQAPLFTEGQQ